MNTFNPITREQIKNWMDEKKPFILIDTLGQESYQNMHVPGAKSLNGFSPLFVTEVERLVPDKTIPVVTYCTGFQCTLAPYTAGQLAAAGYQQVYNFEGGLQHWGEKYPLATGDAE